MNVTLYRSRSKRPDSTARPLLAEHVTYECTANSPMDMLRPTIYINTANAPIGYNVAYVEDLDRWYSVGSWVWESGLWATTLSVDPLATWQDHIYKSTQYVVRCASRYDPELVDMMYPATSHVTYDLTGEKSPWDSVSEGSFVLGIIGSDGLTHYEVMSPAKFTKFVSYAFSNEFFDLMSAGEKLLKAQVNPLQYLSSVRWFPYTVPVLPTAGPIRLGWWDTDFPSVIAAPYTDMHLPIVGVKGHPQSGRGSYLDRAPYTQYTLTARPWGQFTLDSGAVRDGIMCRIRVDSITGVGILDVSDIAETTGPIVHSTAQVGISVQVSQVVSDVLKGATSMVSGAVSAALGDYVGAAAGIANGLMSGTIPQASTQGANGGRAGVLGDWTVCSRCMEIAEEDREHLGRPLMSRQLLGDLEDIETWPRGTYLMTQGAAISGAGMSDEEARMIETALNSGIYLLEQCD